MTPLFLNPLPDDKANLYGLILEASGIPYSFRYDEDGWWILAPPEHHQRAFSQITAYTGENLPPRASKAPIQPLFRTYSGLAAAGILAFFYAATGPFSTTPGLAQAKGADAEAILSGELWRCVTALCIHADFLHLLGNMAFIALFGSGVCQVMGYGVGWLAILAAGILGNLAGAVFHQGAHLSGGASTAIFGALGILGGMTAARRPEADARPGRRWLGLGAGLALLAFLGAGPRSDLVAHLFGWLSGTAVGVVYTLAVKAPVSKNKQLPYLTLAAAILLWGWSASGF